APGAGRVGRRRDARAEMLAHLEEGERLGALEAEDRLLGIADGEDRAVGLARSLPGEELLGESGDDAPLLGIGVLRLVDEDVVETAIELEEDPRRDARPAQQRLAREDEVVI